MANRATQSIGTGMKILSGANIPTYTLEYLTSTEKKNQGSFETIVVPYVELGRDNKCGVTFGDDTPTVSRKHAAIERKGDETFIINLSKSNPTLVNGRPVENKYFLNNGDEIQLSVEGPRLRYNTTKAGTAKIGFTNKMNLVMKQAIKPYKTAAVSFLMIFILAMSGSGYMIYNLTLETEMQSQLLAEQDLISREQAETIASLNASNSALAENFEISQQQIEQDRQRMLRDREQFERELAAIKERSQRQLDSLRNVSGGVNYADVIEELKPYVMAISIEGLETNFNGERNSYTYEPNISCTGFLMDGGIFVTARHCVDMYGTDEGTTDRQANLIEHSGGSATYSFTAESYDGSKRLQFSNKDLVQDDSMDRFIPQNLPGNRSGSLRIADFFSGADWAYMQTDYSDGMAFDKPLSGNLRNGTDLFVLGYSYGAEFRVEGNLEPYFSTAKVTLSGLQDGTVHVTEVGWDSGNSGGPVFTMQNGQPTVIGIVTGGYLQASISQQGDVVMTPTSINVVTPLMNF
ncbi:MAG: FHA domain-containing protein [Rhodohalobacter sp.]